LLAAWALNKTTYLTTQSDRDYANAWLIKNSGNNAPPSTINPATQYSGGDFRLFNDLQFSFFEYGGVISSASSIKVNAAVGATPDPCGISPPVPGQADPNNGIQGITPSATGVYMLAEGRIGTTGQAVSQTINGRTVPWIWSVVKFNASGNPITSDVQIFPTYYVYSNGTLTSPPYPQSPLSSFIALDATSERLPSQIQ
jgi:hypothetical protein